MFKKEPVQKNDLFTNWTDLVFNFNSLTWSSCSSPASKYIWLQKTFNIVHKSYELLVWCIYTWEMERNCADKKTNAYYKSLLKHTNSLIIDANSLCTNVVLGAKAVHLSVMFWLWCGFNHILHFISFSSLTHSLALSSFCL